MIGRRRRELINQIEVLLLGILPKTMDGCYDLFVVLWVFPCSKLWVEGSADRLVVCGFIGVVLDLTMLAQDSVMSSFGVFIPGVSFSTVSQTVLCVQSFQNGSVLVLIRILQIHVSHHTIKYCVVELLLRVFSEGFLVISILPTHFL